MAQHIILTTSLLISIFATNNSMEPVKELAIDDKLNNTKTLKFIKKSDKLLTEIIQKEALLINPTDTQKTVSQKTVNILIHQREKFNIQLKSLTTTLHEQQLSEIATHQEQLKNIMQSSKPYQKKLNTCIHTYQNLIGAQLTVLKEIQQAQQLAERGLMVNEFTPLFPKLYPTYEIVRNESNEILLKMTNSYPPYIETLQSSIHSLTNNQDQLKRLVKR